MPLFYFDLFDDRSSTHDAHGEEFASLAEAKTQAIAIVLDTLSEDHSFEPTRHGCRIRDDEGQVLCQVSVVLDVMDRSAEA